MSDNKKVDEVAKAIKDECQAHHYLVSIPENDRLWTELARAGIVKMRVAPLNVLNAGVTTQRRWQAMIDEFLK